ncbi:ATPase AAA [Actinomycetota bacterium]|nr:ATPase AAA [Actinomycetota bacterium]
MPEYKKRLIDSVLERKLESSGGVVLRGPRAVGKTTTALRHAKSSVRLDESEQIINQAKLAPKSLLAGDVPRLIDEWQLVPSIWNTIRTEIDLRSDPGQFILTGSSAPNDDQTRHTGAGRFARITLRPMSLFESGDSTGEVSLSQLFTGSPIDGAFGGLTVEDYAGRIVRGGWPALISRSPEAASDALIDYLDNIASVDLRTLEQPPDPMRITALLRALARNTSTEASLEKLAKEAELYDENITTKTIRKYLDQLTRVFVLEELPAWGSHIQSSIRMRVKPKWHFACPSLACAALHTSSAALLDDLAAMGLLFESLAIRDVRVYAGVAGANVFHYRDSTNLEVDMIVERFDGAWLAIEVKLGGADAIEEAVANFTLLKKRLSPNKLEMLKACVVLTAGNTSYTRADGVVIVSLGHLTS